MNIRRAVGHLPLSLLTGPPNDAQACRHRATIAPACLLVLLMLTSAAHAQSPHHWSRPDRVVVYSPHFDLVPKPYGGLDCPAQPLRLYGFESSATVPTATLIVRLFGPDDPFRGRKHKGVPKEPIRLARRWIDDRFVDLPESPPWRVVTDSLGGATLRVPAGIYELSIVTGDPLGRGIVRVRIERNDSLHAYVTPRAQC